MKREEGEKIAGIYELTVEGRLDKKWLDWFDGLDIFFTGSNTMLLGPVRDQAHLHGLLNKIRDLNLTLLSVEQIAKQKRRMKKNKEES
ncbi:MAG: hypothetical protein JXB26_16530 [Candidatus Aminicenantes bacterium]|nr:hypothetical protein [Candidatus Aminicenantes bacterium]